MGDERSNVSDADVRALAILQLALGLGPVLFWGVVIALSQLPAQAARTPTTGEAQLVALLSVAHVVMAFTSWTAGAFMFERTLARSGDLAHLRGATIVRLALFEAPALFGAIICMQAILLGVAATQPLVWLNAASTFVLLALAVTTFPTRARVERILRGRRNAS